MPEATTATLEVSKKIMNLRGEPAKDMIDPPANITDPKQAPDLTIGSLIAQGLLIGTQEDDMKKALAHFQLADEIQKALNTGGKMEVNEGKISQIEEAYGRIRIPMFKAPLYAGSVLQELNRCKVDILRKNQKPIEK